MALDTLLSSLQTTIEDTRECSACGLFWLLLSKAVCNAGSDLNVVGSWHPRLGKRRIELSTCLESCLEWRWAKKKGEVGVEAPKAGIGSLDVAKEYWILGLALRSFV